MAKVYVRINLDRAAEEKFFAICISLPAVTVGGFAEIKDVYPAMREAVKNAATQYLNAGEKIPWEGDSGGGNAQVWVDLEGISPDNLPPGNSLHHCIACEKEMHGEDYSGKTDVLYDGLICQTTGNYGSTIFDPMSGREKVQFFLCDECAITKGHLMTYMLVESQPAKITGHMSFTQYQDKDNASLEERTEDAAHNLNRALGGQSG